MLIFRVFVAAFCVFSIGGPVAVCGNDETRSSGELCAVRRDKEYQYFQEIGGSLKLHHLSATWSEARVTCRLEGGVLASPTTAELLKAMQQMIQSEPVPLGVFTGIHDFFYKGDFLSIDGVPLDDMPLCWAPGEPGNKGKKEDCLVMNWDGKVADIDCESTRLYLCFKEGVPTQAKVDQCGAVSGYNFEESTGSCYKFHHTCRIWSQAFKVCTIEKAHLAVINSSVEAQFLIRLIEEQKTNDTIENHYLRGPVFIGYHNLFENEDWQTIQGQRLTRDKHIKAHIYGDGKCGTVSMQKLDNSPCNRQYAFICQKKAVV